MELVKKVLITGIGGNVGQGIIRNINTDFPEIYIVGVNVDEFSAGNHLCDAFYKVPYAVDVTYIDTINEIVKKEGIELIIPSTDYEVHELSKHKNQLICEVAVSDNFATELCLDKMETFYHFLKNDIPFAKAFLPSDYKGQFRKHIVKPREGRGSRGIHINPNNPNQFSDDYMVQELHIGVEVTIAFYVNKNKELHGFIVQERTLEAGATKNSKSTKKYDNLVFPVLEKLIKTTPIHGSANLQAIITDAGEIHPFEINCRISGTNSIRSQFGFKDVKYTIQEWLLNEEPEKPQIREGVATRIMMDVIYTEEQNFEALENKSAKHYIF
jgi:carbamoyl-phosphate synthase large subunit